MQKKNNSSNIQQKQQSIQKPLNTQNKSSQQSLDLDLKIIRIQSDQLSRNDLILHQQTIWRCQSVNMHIFQNTQTKIQQKIEPLKLQNHLYYLKCEKLELIPHQWKINQTADNLTQVQLKGQELGLGQIHQIQVVGMRQFTELDYIKNQKEKGKNIPYKVLLCSTKRQKCYMIAAVDIINNAI